MALDLGADDYLTKPFTIEAMRETLERWLPGERDCPESYSDQESGHGSLCDQHHALMSTVM
jgi:DNA-binding response OmpR family regulator